MSRRDLLKELAVRPLLCDGAMGTQLMARGLATGACGELWNVEKPEIVEAIHRAYQQAGCDLITTNTFGGCSESLQRHGAAARVEELNKAGAQAARKAVGQAGGFVLGDIGPFGGFLEPVGDMSADRLTGIFAQQAKGLLAGGADAAIVETMSDPAEMAVAIRAARSVDGGWPVVATYAFAHGEGDSFRTMMGTSVEEAIGTAIEAGASIVGANCGTQLSLEDYVRLAGQLVAAAGKTPVILQPNAGSPKIVDGKLVYAATPADMAQMVPGLLAAGVRIIGGCCGTTPDHLRAMGQAVRA